MTILDCLSRRALGAIILSILLSLGGGLAGAALAQQNPVETPDLAAMEANYEEAFAAALGMPEDSEPVFVLQAWGTVIMSAVMLDRARSFKTGEGAPPVDAEAVAERVLERWQRIHPETGGPDLIRAFRIPDPSSKQSAVLELLDRYPEDALVVWQAIQELRWAGKSDRASEVAETFLSKRPEHPLAYRLLVEAAGNNSTRLAEALFRWALAAPGDPALVVRWMSSDLPQRDPGATRRLLGELFAQRPTGAAGLDACLRVLRDGDPAFTKPARACVARIAGDPELPAQVSERAASAMVGTAAEDGDWSALVAALDTLERVDRMRALIAGAYRLAAPERCGERVELLALAAEVITDDEGGHRAVASALRSCSELPAARSLYLVLLQQAAAHQVSRVVNAWIGKVNGVYRGELPAEAADILEQRLEIEADEVGLFEALDVVYQLTDADARRFELLRRWHREAPSSLGAEQATALAWGFLERGDAQDAAEFLEQQLELRFESDLASTLWQVYLATVGEERAEQMATDLLASAEPLRERAGHVLAARSAALREELAVAERHYLRALEGDLPDLDVAVELLYVLARREAPDLEETAHRICEKTSLGREPNAVARCAADLLLQAGSGNVASAFLTDASTELPEDPKTLSELAALAQSAGRTDVAERALRRILELDPRAAAGWINLGVLLEKQERPEELEDLLERSRELFSPPPIGLYRAVGRALTAAGRPQQAIDLLLEARSTLPGTRGGEWSRGWIDHELRGAYRALGEQNAVATPPSGPAPLPALATSAPPDLSGSTAGEVRMTADALYSGAGGRYDPDAAVELYAQAAALGDPSAAFRLALVQRLAPFGTPAGTSTAEQLYRSSAVAVEALAVEGDAYAQYLLGTAALIGLGSHANALTARRWLEPAATGGESWAWHNLAWMAETGRGLETPDPAAALHAYRRASAAGNTQSMVEFARLTLTFSGSGELCEEGLRWLERSASAGNARAAAFLGKLLLYGRGQCVAREAQAAVEWLEAGAATHQPGADFDLAMALLTVGDEASRDRAVEILEQVASQSDILAVEILAFLHTTGIAAARDPARASHLLAEAARLGSDLLSRLREEASSEDFRQLLRRGARRLEALSAEGDAAAMAFLALLHSVGLGGEIERERTVSLARHAAAAGETIAMRLLRDAYKRGDGVERDPVESLRWQRRCAEKGDSFCMMFEGHDLLEGEELERDTEAGLAWLRRSAEAGNWWAVGELGRLYDEGRYGVRRDPDQALAWKRRLAELGDAEAVGWLTYHGYH